MKVYPLLRPLLFIMDPEKVHERTLFLGETLSGTCFNKYLRKIYRYEHPALETSVWGLKFKNPVGLAAGFDKDGRLLNFLPSLGFGFLEVGTVTPKPQSGNEKPRLFRLKKDGAILNRMGFNNRGSANLAQKMKTRNSGIPVGANIGRNKSTSNENAIQDYENCFKELFPLADYMVINVSSPNTPSLRELQAKDSLRSLLARIADLNRLNAPRSIPLLLKIAPDLNQEEVLDIADTIKEIGIDGVIVTNTTSQRENLRTSTGRVATLGAGGISGEPLREKSTQIISLLFQELGPKTPIIGVGGIFSAEQAYEKICAGATLIQVWTGLVYEGPGLIKDINRGLVKLLLKDGLTNINQAIGINSK